jgi:hypothetical protein
MHQGAQGYWLMKKTEGRESRGTLVPLSFQLAGTLIINVMTFFHFCTRYGHKKYWTILYNGENEAEKIGILSIIIPFSEIYFQFESADGVKFLEFLHHWAGSRKFNLNCIKKWSPWHPGNRKKVEKIDLKKINHTIFDPTSIFSGKILILVLRALPWTVLCVRI